VGFGLRDELSQSHGEEHQEREKLLDWIHLGE
jgi:hypothetical protein